MGIFKKTEPVQTMPELKNVADFLVEDYRFRHSYISAVDKLFLEEKKKYESAYNFHITKVAELSELFHLRIVVFDGQIYDEGMPITPLNADEFEKEDRLVVQQTIEPTVITFDGKIIRTGTVILSAAPQNSAETTSENQNEEGK